MPASIADYLAKIDVTAKTLLRIINDILDFSKVESGKMDFEEIPFNLSEVLDNTLQMLHTRAVREKVLCLRFDVGEGVASRGLWESGSGRSCSTLLGNAVKFTHEGSVTLCVRCVETDQFVTLGFAVRDTGIGIPADKLPSLFQPFIQAVSGFPALRRHGPRPCHSAGAGTAYGRDNPCAQRGRRKGPHSVSRSASPACRSPQGGRKHRAGQHARTARRAPGPARRG